MVAHVFSLKKTGEGGRPLDKCLCSYFIGIFCQFDATESVEITQFMSL